MCAEAKHSIVYAPTLPLISPKLTSSHRYFSQGSGHGRSISSHPFSGTLSTFYPLVVNLPFSILIYSIDLFYFSFQYFLLCWSISPTVSLWHHCLQFCSHALHTKSSLFILITCPSFLWSAAFQQNHPHSFLSHVQAFSFHPFINPRI